MSSSPSTAAPPATATKAPRTPRTRPPRPTAETAAPGESPYWVRAYKGQLIQCMSFIDGVKYPMDHEFSREELRRVTADDIVSFFNFKTYGTTTPGPEDTPSKLRYFTLKFSKKAINYFMPDKGKWNDVKKRGNPVMSLQVKQMIRRVHDFEKHGKLPPSASSPTADSSLPTVPPVTTYPTLPPMEATLDDAPIAPVDTAAALADEDEQVAQTLKKSPGRAKTKPPQRKRKSSPKVATPSSTKKRKPTPSTAWAKEVGKEDLLRRNKRIDAELVAVNEQTNAELAAIKRNVLDLKQMVFQLDRRQGKLIASMTQLVSQLASQFARGRSVSRGMDGITDQLQDAAAIPINPRIHELPMENHALPTDQNPKQPLASTDVKDAVPDPAPTSCHQPPDTTTIQTNTITTIDDDDDDDKLIPLAKAPPDLDALWREYQYGLDGNKPVKNFSQAQKGFVRHIYCRRRAFWLAMTLLLEKGHTEDEAIGRIYEAYGHCSPRCSVSMICRAITTDRSRRIDTLGLGRAFFKD